MFKTWKEIDLWKRIIAALILGLLVGIFFGDFAKELKPIGTLFINLIKMLIVPLVFVTLVSGVTAMEDLKKMGRIGGKTFVIYLVTTAIAISIGLLVGTVVQPGVGVEMTDTHIITTKEAPALIDILLNVVTKNPFASFTSGNILQIIFFGILLGISINLAKQKGEPAKKFFDSMSETMYKMTEMIMEFAPFGVFGLMAWVAASYGADVLFGLAKVIIGVYLASIIHLFIVVGGGIFAFAKQSPFKFFKGILSAQALAFSTTSSSGTLPVTTENVTKNLGVSKPVASFVLPLGATINMDGTAIYQGVCALFVAQVFGIDLSLNSYLIIILTGTLASIGTAGVPGAGLVMLTLVLTSVGLPIEGVAIIAGIDRILDMARTTVNVTGDAMVSVLIAKSEGELNTDIYDGKSVGRVVAKKPSAIVLESASQTSKPKPKPRVKPKSLPKVELIADKPSTQPAIVKTTPKPVKPVSKPVKNKSTQAKPIQAKPIAKISPRPQPSPRHRQIIVVIDAGHGGKDSGAVGKYGTKEKTVVLQIAKRLKNKIDAMPGMRAKLTRRTDRYISLRGRLRLARKYKADLFVSIHADAARNRTAQGASAYILSNRGASSESARWLARRENAVDLKYGVDIGDYDRDVSNMIMQIQQDATIESSHLLAKKTIRQMKGIGKLHKSRVERAGFAVLKSPDIPSMLVETAFITNPSEERKLNSSSYQNQLAEAIAKGIKNYFDTHASQKEMAWQ